jgi:hypothetical protein
MSMLNYDYLMIIECVFSISNDSFFFNDTIFVDKGDATTIVLIS